MMNSVSFKSSYNFLKNQQDLYCACCGNKILSNPELKKISKELVGKKGEDVADKLEPYKDFFTNEEDSEALTQLIDFSRKPEFQNYSFNNIAIHLNKKSIYSNNAEQTLKNLLTPILLSADHINPRSNGGQDSYGNYLPMHISCNSRRSSKSYAEMQIENPDLVKNIKKCLTQIWERMNSKNPKLKINLPKDYIDKVKENLTAQGIDITV